jgi:hypothetical protein
MDIQKLKLDRLKNGQRVNGSGDYHNDYVQCLESLLERSDNSGYAVASPKLPSLDSVFDMMQPSTKDNELAIEAVYDCIKTLGNFA